MKYFVFMSFGDVRILDSNDLLRPFACFWYYSQALQWQWTVCSSRSVVGPAISLPSIQWWGRMFIFQCGGYVSCLYHWSYSYKLIEIWKSPFVRPSSSFDCCWFLVLLHWTSIIGREKLVSYKCIHWSEVTKCQRYSIKYQGKDEPKKKQNLHATWHTFEQHPIYFPAYLSFKRQALFFALQSCSCPLSLLPLSLCLSQRPLLFLNFRCFIIDEHAASLACKYIVTHCLALHTINLHCKWCVVNIRWFNSSIKHAYPVVKVVKSGKNNAAMMKNH